METNQNEYKVVTFFNKTDFDFTPELGAMYDSRPVFGISGDPCIKAGESVTLPYNVGKLLAQNLAKAMMVKNAPQLDASGIPTGVPIWDEPKLIELQNSFLTDVYSQDKPKAMSETDRLFARIEELAKLVEGKEPVVTEDAEPSPTSTFADKAEVIAELKKREIPYDARKSKSELEKLIV